MSALNMVALRPLQQGDYGPLFAFHNDKEALFLAGAGKPFEDEAEVKTHFDTVQQKGALVRAILFEDRIAGYAASFMRFDKQEISYWLGRDYWGQGIASRAVGLWLTEFPPTEIGLFARVVDGNPASARVLVKNGFTAAGRDRFFSDIRGAEVEETLFKYGAP